MVIFHSYVSLPEGILFNWQFLYMSIWKRWFTIGFKGSVPKFCQLLAPNFVGQSCTKSLRYFQGRAAEVTRRKYPKMIQLAALIVHHVLTWVSDGDPQFWWWMIIVTCHKLGFDYPIFIHTHVMWAHSPLDMEKSWILYPWDRGRYTR